MNYIWERERRHTTVVCHTHKKRLFLLVFILVRRAESELTLVVLLREVVVLHTIDGLGIRSKKQ